MNSNKPKYQPISTEELKAMLSDAQSHYLSYCKKNAEYMVATEGQPYSAAVKHPMYKEAMDHLRISTGIFDEAMRRAARDYSDEKYEMLRDYYQYVRIETAWGTRLWMDFFYNIMGFPKTFWLMRHFKWLL